jgi:hypothetical protein
LIETRAVLASPRSAALVLGLSALLVASCDRCGGGERGDRRDAGGAAPALPSATTGASAAPANDGDASAEASDAEAASLADAAPADAGSSSCRLAYGPAEQAFRGPAAMIATATELRLVANDGGRPRVFTVPLGPPPAPSARPKPPPSPASFVAMRWPPCELAGRWAYCQAAGGLVYRTTLGGKDTLQVAKSQPSTRIAASALGPDHAIVATLDSRRTTEGVLMQAFVTLDNGEPQRLSDDGAGATVLRLVPRGAGAVALYLDARTAMVPVHARPIALRGQELALGEDAVVFVGGPPERGIELTPALAGSALFALIPTGRETIEFGMAAIPIAEEPKADVQPVWSLYPNGLDPAPVGATLSAQAADGGGGSAWVARVRPAAREPGSPRILELGRIDSAAQFTSLGTLAEDKRITDIAISSDAYGSVWVLYGDSNATWLERRVCP